MTPHDLIAAELFENHSLGALAYLIDRGRELEFRLGEKSYFLSRDGSKGYVSLWHSKEEQSFASMDDLMEHAVLDGQPFLLVWQEAEMDTLF